MPRAVTEAPYCALHTTTGRFDLVTGWGRLALIKFNVMSQIVHRPPKQTHQLFSSVHGPAVPMSTFHQSAMMSASPIWSSQNGRVDQNPQIVYNVHKSPNEDSFCFSLVQFSKHGGITLRMGVYRRKLQKPTKQPGTLVHPLIMWNGKYVSMDIGTQLMYLFHPFWADFEFTKSILPVVQMPCQSCAELNCNSAALSPALSSKAQPGELVSSCRSTTMLNLKKVNNYTYNYNFFLFSTAFWTRGYP